MYWFEGIDVKKTNVLGECIIFHYCYLLEVNLRFYPKVGCHELKQKAIGFNDVAIVSTKRNDYRILTYEQRLCHKYNENI